MIIVLRLRGLDVKAGTEDIRRFFNCIHIPDGGVYIVGGRQKEAFIAFTTEEDVQLAMQQNGTFLKRSKVTLCLSSMEELEHKLKSLLKEKKSFPTKPGIAKKPPSPTAAVSPSSGKHLNPNSANIPSSTATLSPSAATSPPSTTTPQTIDSQSLNSNAALILKVCTVLKSLQQSYNEGENNGMLPRIDFPQVDSRGVAPNEMNKPEKVDSSGPGYVRLFGLPASTTKEDICLFFKGLTIQEVIVNVLLGLKHGCLVKFANAQDACDALCFNQKSLGSICVEVRGATEKMWSNALQTCENGFDVEDKVIHKQRPLRESANHRPTLTSSLQNKRKPVNNLPTLCKPPKMPRTTCDSTTVSATTEHIVMVRKVPKTMTKTEIKELFGCPNLAHKKVLHLLDQESHRTDTAFLTFDQTEDYEYAMNLNGCHVGSEAIEVSSVTREKMRDIMAKARPRNLNQGLKKDTKRIFNSVEKPGETPNTNLDPAAQTCVFVRNLPENVQIGHIKGLFRRYKPSHDGITILHDSDGKCIGEAVVQFKSQKHATMAQQLNSRNFLGAKVLLTLINVKQMEDILAKNV